jgi:hypothetical protein
MMAKVRSAGAAQIHQAAPALPWFSSEAFFWDAMFDLEADRSNADLCGMSRKEHTDRCMGSSVDWIQLPCDLRLDAVRSLARLVLIEA